MKIEIGINPNCSEAVMRFYTLEPKQIQIILQAVADEISANTNFKPHKKQKIPLLKTVDEYDTKNTGTLLEACAGMGDNEAIITIEDNKKAFRLNIGNNDLTDKTNWVEKIKALNIKIEEADVGENDLHDYARDCTCGITFFE